MIKAANIIGNSPAISAIYFALLQSGYDYYSLGRTQEQIEAVKSFYKPELSSCFFSQAKQNTCKAYSYWPRAALLESATFYIDADTARFSDFEAYKKFVMSASNLKDTERNKNFWSWISAFPKELNKIINSEHFKEYLKWEDAWIEQQIHAEALTAVQEAIETCISRYNTAINNVKIVLSPIKCAYSSDYHIVDKQLIFSSGEFNSESVIHEFLHHIVHPYILNLQSRILVSKRNFDGIDSSYYLSDNENGKLNAFEEYSVRALTKEISSQTLPNDLEKYILSLLNEV